MGDRFIAVLKMLVTFESVEEEEEEEVGERVKALLDRDWLIDSRKLGRPGLRRGSGGGVVEGIDGEEDWSVGRWTEAVASVIAFGALIGVLDGVSRWSAGLGVVVDRGRRVALRDGKSLVLHWAHIDR